MDKIIKKWLEADLEIADLTLEVIAELPNFLDSIGKAVESGDLNLIFKECHKLKGLSGNYHMKEIYNLSGNISRESKKDNPDIEKIKSYYLELKEFIERIPDEYFE